MKPSHGWRKQKPSGQCVYSQACKRPSGKLYYCAYHRQKFRKSQNATRWFRRRLGFCIYCLERAAPGHRRCQKHLDTHARISRAYRERQMKARGWKMIRVKA